MRLVPPIANPSPDPSLPYRDASAGSFPGSWPGAEFFNSIVAELVHLISFSGQAPSAGDLEQVRKAVEAIVANVLAGNASAPTDFRVITSGPITSPPGSPVAGGQYLVDASATGAFAGKDHQIATRNGAGWSFSGAVTLGRVFRVGDTNTYFVRAAGGWAEWSLPISAISGLQTALDGKVAKAGDTMSGSLKVGGDPNNRVDVGPGSIEITNASSAPHVDFKNSNSEDFDARIIREVDRLTVVSNTAGAPRARFSLVDGGQVALTDGSIGPRGTVLMSGGATGAAVWGSGVAQNLYAENLSYVDLANGISPEAFAPTTEGVEILALSVTPLHASSVLRIRFSATVGHNGGAYPAARILMAGVNLLTVCSTIEYSPWFGLLTGVVQVPAGHAGARGISVRAGNLGGPQAIKLNGSSSWALTGSRAILTVEEIT